MLPAFDEHSHKDVGSLDSVHQRQVDGVEAEGLEQPAVLLDHVSRVRLVVPPLGFGYVIDQLNAQRVRVLVLPEIGFVGPLGFDLVGHESDSRGRVELALE